MRKGIRQWWSQSGQRVWGSRGPEEEIMGGMCEVVEQVCAVLYQSRSPDHQTEGGKLLHAALLQFYLMYLPPEQRVGCGRGCQADRDWAAKAP
ncbi:hypothetical protein [Reticulibacter mediterranei]|uniref:hypothetical protein n=1 Tax=Reticulibacter mediterranei TaxID=2778369 RepID=UPI001C68BB42|nr:hypothetical protein [Reticulibacter mediterranei]